MASPSSFFSPRTNQTGWNVNNAAAASPPTKVSMPRPIKNTETTPIAAAPMDGQVGGLGWRYSAITTINASTPASAIEPQVSLGLFSASPMDCPLPMPKPSRTFYQGNGVEPLSYSPGIKLD